MHRNTEMYQIVLIISCYLCIFLPNFKSYMYIILSIFTLSFNSHLIPNSILLERSYFSALGLGKADCIRVHYYTEQEKLHIQIHICTISAFKCTIKNRTEQQLREIRLALEAQIKRNHEAHFICLSGKLSINTTVCISGSPCLQRPCFYVLLSIFHVIPAMKDHLF